MTTPFSAVAKSLAREPWIASKDYYNNLHNENLVIDKIPYFKLSNAEWHFLKMGLNYDEKESLINWFNSHKEEFRECSKLAQNLVKLSY